MAQRTSSTRLDIPTLSNDAQQIFLDGVLAKPEFGGDSAVGQAIGHEGNHLLFARPATFRRIAENNELVQGAGYSLNNGDQSDWEHMLGFLIRNPELRRQAAVRERDRIQNEFRWPHVAQLVEAAYYDVLGWAPNPHRNSIRVDASVAR